MSMLFNNKQLS